MKNRKPVESSDSIPATSGRVWYAKLSLTRRHWHQLEDIADAIRRDGTYYRPNRSQLVRSVLDVTLPMLLETDFRPLATLARDRDRVATRVLIHAWLTDLLERRTGGERHDAP